MPTTMPYEDYASQQAEGPIAGYDAAADAGDSDGMMKAGGEAFGASALPGITLAGSALYGAHTYKKVAAGGDITGAGAMKKLNDLTGPNGKVASAAEKARVAAARVKGANVTQQAMKGVKNATRGARAVSSTITKRVGAKVGERAAQRAAASAAARVGIKVVSRGIGGALGAVGGPAGIAAGIAASILLEKAIMAFAHSEYATKLVNVIRGGAGPGADEPPQPPNTSWLQWVDDDRAEAITGADSGIEALNAKATNYDPVANELWRDESPVQTLPDMAQTRQGFVDLAKKLSDHAGNIADTYTQLVAENPDQKWVKQAAKAAGPILEDLKSLPETAVAPLAEAYTQAVGCANDVYQAIREANLHDRAVIASSHGKWFGHMGRATIDETQLTVPASEVETYAEEIQRLCGVIGGLLTDEVPEQDQFGPDPAPQAAPAPEASTDPAPAEAAPAPGGGMAATGAEIPTVTSGGSTGPILGGERTTGSGGLFDSADDDRDEHSDSDDHDSPLHGDADTDADDTGTDEPGTDDEAADDAGATDPVGDDATDAGSPLTDEPLAGGDTPAGDAGILGDGTPLGDAIGSTLDDGAGRLSDLADGWETPYGAGGSGMDSVLPEYGTSVSDTMPDPAGSTMTTGDGSFATDPRAEADSYRDQLLGNSADDGGDAGPRYGSDTSTTDPGADALDDVAADGGGTDSNPAVDQPAYGDNGGGVPADSAAGGIDQDATSPADDYNPDSADSHTLGDTTGGTEGGVLGDEPTDNPLGDTLGGDTPGGDTTASIGGTDYDFNDPKLAELADRIADGDGTESLRDIAADVGLEPGAKGDDIGVPISPADAQAGDVVCAKDGDYLILDADTALNESGEVVQRESITMGGEHQGVFHLAGSDAPAPDDAGAWGRDTDPSTAGSDPAGSSTPTQTDPQSTSPSTPAGGDQPTTGSWRSAEAPIGMGAGQNVPDQPTGGSTATTGGASLADGGPSNSSADTTPELSSEDGSSAATQSPIAEDTTETDDAYDARLDGRPGMPGTGSGEGATNIGTGVTSSSDSGDLPGVVGNDALDPDFL